MTSDGPPLELEISGETVGEAKWLALRELARLHPGLDRELVQFEVLSEGERGLLGVGTSPARVIARVDPAAVLARDLVEPSPEAPPADEGSLAAFVREIVERIALALGAECRVELREDSSGVYATVSGRGVGLLIGRGGRTIDAVQYLVSAAARRRQEEGEPVDVDAAGYRERRRARLTSMARRAADRAVERGESVALQPMTSPERKLVHVALQDVQEVETHSEGEEPERYVVVVPTAR